MGIGSDGEERLARVRAITDRLVGEQFVGRSGAAGAVVDGHGALVDLRVADQALTVRTLDLDALNQDILDAISDARQQATERAAHLLRPAFPAFFSVDGDGGY